MSPIGFGTFKRTVENWIFLTELTWLYAERPPVRLVLGLSEKLGWGWTGGLMALHLDKFSQRMGLLL